MTQIPASPDDLEVLIEDVRAVLNLSPVPLVGPSPSHLDAQQKLGMIVGAARDARSRVVALEQQLAARDDAVRLLEEAQASTDAKAARARSPKSRVAGSAQQAVAAGNGKAAAGQ